MTRLSQFMIAVFSISLLCQVYFDTELGWPPNLVIGTILFAVAFFVIIFIHWYRALK